MRMQVNKNKTKKSQKMESVKWFKIFTIRNSMHTILSTGEPIF